MAKTKKIAVVLSGCGVFDGSEIHEATLTLLAISKLGGEYSIFAPNIEQYHVINHLTGTVMNEKRNVLIESARIARGKIQPLSLYKATAFDGLIFPGGFGAAKNLSTYAAEGEKMNVNPDVERAINETAKQSKPIGAFCIAPVLISKVLGNVILTIGKDLDTANQLEKLGSTHVTTGHGEIAIDSKNKIVTTPCYMIDSTIAEIYDGIENAVRALFKMVE
jgi:enhancing lycopene biosynthesis protein 2